MKETRPKNCQFLCHWTWPLFKGSPMCCKVANWPTAALYKSGTDAREKGESSACPRTQKVYFQGLWDLLYLSLQQAEAQGAWGSKETASPTASHSWVILLHCRRSLTQIRYSIKAYPRKTKKSAWCRCQELADKLYTVLKREEDKKAK